MLWKQNRMKSQNRAVHENPVSWNSCDAFGWRFHPQWCSLQVWSTFTHLHAMLYCLSYTNVTYSCTFIVYFVRMVEHYRTLQVSRCRWNVEVAAAVNQTHLNLLTRLCSFSGECDRWSDLYIWFLICASVGFLHPFSDPAGKSVASDHLQ